MSSSNIDRTNPTANGALARGTTPRAPSQNQNRTHEASHRLLLDGLDKPSSDSVTRAGISKFVRTVSLQDPQVMLELPSYLRSAYGHRSTPQLQASLVDLKGRMDLGRAIAANPESPLN